MNAAHTPEPWSVDDENNICADGRVIAHVVGPKDANGNYIDFDRETADAHRIVACVNACTGLPLVTPGCNCPGENKPEPNLHAPNCPYRANRSGKPVAYRYKLCGAGGTLLSAVNPAKGDKNERGIYANGVYDVEPLFLAAAGQEACHG